VSRALDQTTEPTRRRQALIASAVIGLSSIAFFLFSGPAAELDRFTRPERILDLTPGYTAEWVHREFTRYGPRVRALFGEFLVRDAIFATIYTAAAAVWIALSLERSGAAVRRLTVIPLLTGLTDWVEDALSARSLSLYPELDPTVIQIASSVTLVKWSLALATVILVLLGLGVIGYEIAVWWRRRRDVGPTAALRKGLGRSA
jgi:hypothetical protein